MARQIHQLLHLAEANGVQNYQLEDVGLSVAVADALTFPARLAEHHGLLL